MEEIYLSITCPNCGEENGEGAKFCKKCGVPLEVQDSSSDKASSIFSDEPKTQSKSKRNIILIAVAVILCIAAIAGAMIYMNGDLFNEKEPMHIINTTFTTGHSLDAKTVCTINVGSNHSGENVTVSIKYSRDGTDLNKGDESKETVDLNGDIICESEDAFELYPDRAIVTLYDEEGNKIDSADISLKTDDSTQVALGNGTVTAKSISEAKHSASSSSSSGSSSGSHEWVEDLDLSDKAGEDAHVYIHHKSDGTKYYYDENGKKVSAPEDEEWVF